MKKAFETESKFVEELAEDIRRVAYLLDVRTISIVDMAKNNQIAQIQHSIAIDWLEVEVK
jgi:hypothetical protein